MRRQGVALAGIGLAGALLAAGGCSSQENAARRSPSSSQATIGLFTSLPIYWDEAGDVAGLLRDGAPPHWALAALRRHGVVVPLDTVAGTGQEEAALAAVDVLVMAQPRPLSPEENVALDDWVKAGGRVLLFADPMLTHEGIHAPGDARRPQDIAMLSPILGQWGLVLRFDDEQPAGERMMTLFGRRVPVDLAGQFSPLSRVCEVLAEGLAARCRVGGGRVLAFADARMLDRAGDGRDDDEAARLLDDMLSDLGIP